jgi:hypothetical protein
MNRHIFALLILALTLAALFPASAPAAALPQASYEGYARVGQEYSRSPMGDVIFRHGSPASVIQSGSNEYLVTDTFYNVVWRVVPGLEPEPFAGQPSSGGYRDAAGAEALCEDPWGIAPFLDGWLVSDTGNHVVRYIGDGRVKTAAGGGLPGLADGRGTRALLNGPTGLAADGAGGVYIADTLNNLIRRLDKAGNITTAAGTGKQGNTDGTALSAEFSGPVGLAFHDGALYIADTGNHRIRKLENGLVSTVAGVNLTLREPDLVNGETADGPVSAAKFSAPMGIAVGFDGSLLVTDSGGGAVRRIAGGNVTTVAMADPEFGDAVPVSPAGLLSVGKDLFVCDLFSGVVYKPFPPVEDVTYADSFIREVSFCCWSGVLRETGPARFDPQGLLTRETAAVAVARAYAAEHGDAELSNMSDSAALAWAEENGVADAAAAPADVTVGDFCAMLYRMAALEDEENDSSNADGYSWAQANGLVDAGAPPSGYLTRAQAAVMLYNFLRHA